MGQLSYLYHWTFENPRWWPFFGMAAQNHLPYLFSSIEVDLVGQYHRFLVSIKYDAQLLIKFMIVSVYS